ncbi:MAG: hypothetical protein V3U72_04580 [Candidatus Aenigmarchaeota archaeon]
MVYEIVVILLLVIICFLLYKLYKIKYTEGRGSSELISESWKKNLMELNDDKGKGLEIRFGDINSRISEIEERIRRNERVVEKLVKELS